MEIKELYASVVGSHAWEMNREDSDYDYWVIYQAPSRSFLLGNTHRKGHSSSGKVIGIKWDRSSFEIGQHVRDLMGGNINHVVCLLAPSVRPFEGKDPTPLHWDVAFDYIRIRNFYDTTSYKVSTTPQRSHTEVKLNLRKIFLSNPSKNIFKSINGMTSHNINRFFVKEHKSNKPNPQFIPNTKENEPIRIKKLGQIRRLVEFGFRVLIDGIYDLRPVEVFDGSDSELSVVRQWQKDLQHAYDASKLPEKPDKEPYEEFLMDLRMSMLEVKT